MRIFSENNRKSAKQIICTNPEDGKQESQAHLVTGIKQFCGSSTKSFAERSEAKLLFESLILAQDERWRRA